MRVGIAADHGGFALKEEIVEDDHYKLKANCKKQNVELRLKLHSQKI